MHNQHAGLSQLLATQRITERQEQAARVRLAHGTGRRRRRRRWLAARWWQLVRWPGAATSRPSTTHTPSVDRSEAPMSKLTRTLAVGTMLAAVSLAGMTAVAHAYPLDPATDQPTSHQARRPPTQGQVEEAWHQRPASSQQQTAGDAALGRVLARERFSIPSGTPAQVPAPAPAPPSGQPGWLVVSLGMLAAALAVVAGLAMLTARRANHRARVGPAT
jgi:hypothetical protein